MNASTSPRSLLLLSIALGASAHDRRGHGGYAQSHGGRSTLPVPLTHAALHAHGTRSPTMTEASFMSGRTRDSVTDGTHTWTGQLGGRRSSAEATRTGFALRPLGHIATSGDTHFGFEHDPLYVRDDEDDLEARVRYGRGTAGVQSAPVADYSEHDITAHREAENAGIVRSHGAKADNLKRTRDSEEKALCQRKYAIVIKSGESAAEETRLAPDVTFRPLDDGSADPRRVELGQRVEHEVEGEKKWLWSPAALTRAQFQTILGNTMVVDRDDETYDYLAASGTVGKMTNYAKIGSASKDQIYAEKAHEFFWRRAPAKFDVSGPTLLSGGAQAVAHRRGSDMKIAQAGAHAYTHAKMIKLLADDTAQPTTSYHFRLEANIFRITQDVWEAEEATITDPALMQIANEREAAYKAAHASSFVNKARDAEKKRLQGELKRRQSEIAALRKQVANAERALNGAPAAARDGLKRIFDEKQRALQAEFVEYRRVKAELAALEPVVAPVDPPLPPPADTVDAATAAARLALHTVTLTVATADGVAPTITISSPRVSTGSAAPGATTPPVVAETYAPALPTLPVSPVDGVASAHSSHHTSPAASVHSSHHTSPAVSGSVTPVALPTTIAAGAVYGAAHGLATGTTYTFDDTIGAIVEPVSPVHAH